MKRFGAVLLSVIFVCCLFSAAYAEEHYFGEWSYRRDGVHRAQCTKCEYIMYVECGEISCNYEGKTFAVCPVCGHYNNSDGYSIRSSALLFDYSTSPIGDALLMRYDAPFGDGSEILRAYSVIFEYAGEMMDYDGLMKISFSDDLPSDFTLLAANDDGLSEIQYELDSENSEISFILSGSQNLILVKAK